MTPASAAPRPRGYTIDEVCDKAGDLPRRTFHYLRARGRLPFLVEILPRLSARRPLYRADLVDEYFANQNRTAAHEHARIR